MSTKGGRRLSTAEKDERRLSSAVARIRKGPPPHLWHPLDQFSGSGTNVVGAPSANARPKATKLADYDEAADLPSEPKRGAVSVPCAGEDALCPWCLLRQCQQEQRQATAARARTQRQQRPTSAATPTPTPAAAKGSSPWRLLRQCQQVQRSTQRQQRPTSAATPTPAAKGSAEAISAAEAAVAAVKQEAKGW